jgi:hypothetical protein
MNTTEAKVIRRLERLRNSANGNPRFRVFFANGDVADTKPDADVAFGLGNRENMEPNEVIVTFERGQIVNVQPVEKG